MLSKAICQQYKLAPLIKAFNSQSLAEALEHMKGFVDFKGGLYAGRHDRDSSVRGIVGKDSIFARRKFEKIMVYQTFHNQSEFLGLLAEAKKNLHEQEPGDKGSEISGIYFKHYIFSLGRELKYGDLMVKLNYINNKEAKEIYYQVLLTTFE